MDLFIEQRSINTIKPYAQHSRVHKKPQIAQLVASIREFGFLVPVLIDHDGGVIAGHGRILAAAELGLTHLPCIAVSHLSAAQKRAFIIADNKLTENATWNGALLAQEFQELIKLDLGFSIEITGFKTCEIDILIEEHLHIEADDGSNPEAIPESAPSIARIGDLWQLGSHHIYCGNALDIASFSALMQEEKAQMVLTDPPYNVAIDGHVCGAGKIRHREFAMAAGEMSVTDFTTFLHTVFTHMRHFSSDGSLHYVFMDWRHMREILNAGYATFATLKNLCVWVKDNAGMGSFYRSRHELVFIFKNGEGKHINNIELGTYGRYRSNVWEYAGINSFAGRKAAEGNLLSMHPTVKPVVMLEDAIKDASQRKDLILDPFLGSGSTLIAAERTGRRCYGIEIDPLYIDTIIQRWEHLTGQQAIQLACGIPLSPLTIPQTEKETAL